MEVNKKRNCSQIGLFNGSVTHSLMAYLTFAAKDGLKTFSKIVMKIAFFKTEMEGHKNLTHLIVDILPGIKKYVTK